MLTRPREGARSVCQLIGLPVIAVCVNNSSLRIAGLVAADLDIEAVINRVDLIALADRVIVGVDLPAIIRESTNSMTACWGVTGKTGDLIG
ncbi:MAG: hypothetical protein QOD97_214, partial [Mycobacterium sp.]|nr:hypothetical protein [Mycobacterium sp.]